MLCLRPFRDVLSRVVLCRVGGMHVLRGVCVVRERNGGGERDEQQHGREGDVQVDMHSSEHVGGRGLEGRKEIG